MSRDFSRDGAAAEAILEFLADGEERSVAEVAAGIGLANYDLVRNQLLRLSDKCQVQRRRTHTKDAAVLYRLSERRQPFLLGEVWRTAFEPAEVAA